MIRRGKVIVAMSGGVDSSVAAAILKKNGYDVVGVFMKFWQEPNRKSENRCCSVEAKRDAQRVAIKLGIPLQIIDVKKEFKKRVVDYFINEYEKGNTPNPCVMCNKYIKFKFLIDEMTELKADFVATGHYARIGKSQIPNPKLLVARDKTKDQTYFLWTLKQNQLKKILFPIGNYAKEQVREMAKKFSLPVFKKKDSQEICFINTCIEDFLKKYIKQKSGPIITIDGKKVGEHEGLVFYTIGQRKGIKIGGTGPYYVIKKDFKRNALIVSNPPAGGQNKDLLQKELVVKNVNWVSGKSYNGKCKVKIRSMTKMADATIKRNKVIFNKPQRAITSGQSAVFYKKNEVLGGGIIV